MIYCVTLLSCNHFRLSFPIYLFIIHVFNISPTALSPLRSEVDVNYARINIYYVKWFMLGPF